MAEKVIPKFQRQDQHKKRLKKVWRKPRGRHSKVRLGKRGHQARVRIGYKVQNPKEIIVITQVSDLKASDTATILVSGKVGKKRKVEIAREAIKQNITLKNLDAAAFIKETEERLSIQKKAKADEKKKVEAQKADEKKKVEAQKETKLEKKVEDTQEEKDAKKRDRDKLLTQRERT